MRREIEEFKARFPNAKSFEGCMINEDGELVSLPDSEFNPEDYDGTRCNQSRWTRG